MFPGHPLQFPREPEAAWALPLVTSWFIECSGFFPGAGVRPRARPCMACRTSKALSCVLLSAGSRWSLLWAYSWAHFSWPYVGCSEWSGSGRMTRVWHNLEWAQETGMGGNVPWAPAVCQACAEFFYRSFLVYPHFMQEDVEAQQSKEFSEVKCRISGKAGWQSASVWSALKGAWRSALVQKSTSSRPQEARGFRDDAFISALRGMMQSDLKLLNARKFLHSAWKERTKSNLRFCWDPQKADPEEIWILEFCWGGLSRYTHLWEKGRRMGWAGGEAGLPGNLKRPKPLPHSSSVAERASEGWTFILIEYQWSWGRRCDSGKVALLSRRQIIERPSIRAVRSQHSVRLRAEGFSYGGVSGWCIHCTAVQKYWNQQVKMGYMDCAKFKNQGVLNIPQLRNARSSHINISEIGMHFAICVKVGLPTIPHHTCLNQWWVLE